MLKKRIGSLFKLKSSEVRDQISETSSGIEKYPFTELSHYKFSNVFDMEHELGKENKAPVQNVANIVVNIEENLSVKLKRDGKLVSDFRVTGKLLLQISEEEEHIRVQFEKDEDAEIRFRFHPILKKDLAKKNILDLNTSERGFPNNPMDWRMDVWDESNLPLTVSCWPSSDHKGTHMEVLYDKPTIELRSVVFSIPLPILLEAPLVKRCDGEWRYDSCKSVLEWSIPLIDSWNSSGLLEFIIPKGVSYRLLFPVSVSFSATTTFSKLKVVDIISRNGGPPRKFSQITQLLMNYEVS